MLQYFEWPSSLVPGVELTLGDIEALLPVCGAGAMLDIRYKTTGGSRGIKSLHRSPLISLLWNVDFKYSKNRMIIKTNITNNIDCFFLILPGEKKNDGTFHFVKRSPREYWWNLCSTNPLSGKSGNSRRSFSAIGFGWTSPPNKEPLDEISRSSDRELS